MPFHFANVLLFSATAILFVFGSLLAGKFLRPNPFRALPREVYGQRIAVNFNAREACS